ncbi:MAG TPA: DNA polymerase III subunit gamma/tau C-terminal domain-containing protein [Burkholderiales bacterium]|nr:DNA polymerase III subunit gamma/tau C-terminal domain-containing protein [Burkholderiales bacterium]
MLVFRPEGLQTDSGLDPVGDAARHPVSTVSRAAASSASAVSARSASATPFDGDWAKLARELTLAGAAKELARNAELLRYEDGTFELGLPKAMAYLADKGYQEKLKAALEQRLGRRAQVRVIAGEVRGVSPAALEAGERDARRSEAARAVNGDRFVQDLVNIFDASVIDTSVHPRPKES